MRTLSSSTKKSRSPVRIEIDAGDVGVDVVRRLDADHLGPEGRVEQDELGRHETRLEDLLVVIDVVEEDVDRLDALDAAPLDQSSTRCGRGCGV